MEKGIEIPLPTSRSHTISHIIAFTGKIFLPDWIRSVNTHSNRHILIIHIYHIRSARSLYISYLTQLHSLEFNSERD